MSESQNRFGDLPVYPASWKPGSLDFPEGADFESSIEEWIAQGELEGSVDEIMTGHPSPRIWLLLHEPGQGCLSGVVALAVARELASRDQGVLILDCDETDSTLTRWAQRTGAEGWADLVRYGASVLTCGIRLPFAGRQGYLLGPGSYVPVDVLAEEITQILARLRRQADDILLVCPSGDTGRRWAGSASIRVLCRDTASMTAARADEITGAFAEAGMPLTGLLRFGDEIPETVSADEPDESVAPVVEEPETPDLAENEEPETAFGFDEEPETSAEPEAPADEDAEAEEDESTAAALESLTEIPSEENPDAWSEEKPDPEVFARKRGTSRVFWWVALGAAALIILSVWYYREYVLEPDPGLYGGERIEVATHDVDAETSGPVTQQPAGTDSGAETGQENDAVVDDGAQETAAINPDTPPATAPGETEVEVTGGTGEQTAPATTPAETPAETAADVAEQTPTGTQEPESQEPEEVEAGFQMDPYLVPVGQDGWALHIYSFPDQENAAKELAILDRKGFRTEVRVVQIKNKGRWHRIYLGSFAGQAEAQAALPLLLGELREDWGRPTKF